MLGALDDLGVKVEKHSPTAVTVEGVAGALPVPVTAERLNLGNAGEGEKEGDCWKEYLF